MLNPRFKTTTKGAEMKASIKEIKQKQFKPFVLKITVETEQDLYDLWHRFNVAYVVINEVSDSNSAPESKGNDAFIWAELNDKLLEFEHA